MVWVPLDMVWVQLGVLFLIFSYETKGLFLAKFWPDWFLEGLYLMAVGVRKELSEVLLNFFRFLRLECSAGTMRELSVLFSYTSCFISIGKSLDHDFSGLLV
jgi:hypothetical protein